MNTSTINRNAKLSNSNPPYQRNENNLNDTPKKGNDYVGATLVDSGVLHHSVGENEKALKAFKTALATQLIMLGSDHACVAHTHSNIGSVQLQLGQLDEAKKSLEDAINIKNMNAGKFLAVGDLTNLGNVHYMRKEYDEAMRCYRMALQVWRDRAEDDPSVADTLHNIGRVHSIKGELQEAMATFKESLRVTMKFLGNDHLNVADTLEKIAWILLSLKENYKALRAFNEVLRVTKVVLGDYHHDVAVSLYNIGVAHEKTGDLSQACEAFTGALDIYMKLNVSNDDINVITVRRSMSNVKTRLEKPTSLIA